MRRVAMRSVAMRSVAVTAAVAGLVIIASGGTSSYPLDGYERTGIRRLEAYRRVQNGVLAGRKLPPGAGLLEEEIRLHLAYSGGGLGENFDITEATPRDPYLQRGLERIFEGRDPNYSVALLDITDPRHPKYAALREAVPYQTGSIGKLAVLTGLFAQLARAYPDTADRIRVLRETQVTADAFVGPDQHAIPIVDLAAGKAGNLSHRVARVGDTFSLWEWTDHMVSPSSNGAGSMVWKQAMLLARFGRDYPTSSERELAYFEETSRSILQNHSVRAINEPLRRMGIEESAFRQGTFFTSEAQIVVPGISSRWTPRALLRWLVKLEQGKVVDRWSSMEIKRLLYFTRGRYRYASSPELRDAAVYFKSGSLYSCRPEPGFTCRQYAGNRFNYMNSVTIVESPARGPNRKVYLVTLASNVLRQNSATEHRDLATLIERLVRDRPDEN